MKNKSLKHRKNTSILVKLSGVAAFFLPLTFVIFSVISVRSVRTSSMETAFIMGQDKLEGDIMYFENLIFNEYGQLSLRDGQLVGLKDTLILPLGYQYDVVDRISADIGIVATVFAKEGNDYRRISTSIIDETGNRVVDTFLGKKSAAYSSINFGRDYCGNAVILGHDYLTYYRPVFAPDNSHIVGILFIGKEMTDIEQMISQSTNNHVRLVSIIAATILLILVVINATSLKLVILKPIRSVTGIISKLAKGDINQQIEESKNLDEIGTMKSELSRMVEGLKHMAEFAQSIGEGNLDAEYQLLSNDDVLGNSLLEMRQSLRDAGKEHALRANEEKQRNWGTAGLAKFAEILRRNNDDMEALSYDIISNMVQYLEVNQGGIFVLNDAEKPEDRLLELKACHAFDRKKFADKQIRPGEGLVGSCYLEREMIYLTDIPDNYINITSGLGESNPKALLICPLKVNDEIFGVIELASFHDFEPYQREFVQKVSESIASTISTVNGNIRTNRLLHQTKMQAEEMANQEEELRQNMEEMRSTQDEMLRHETELRETLKKMSVVQEAGEEKEHQMNQFYQMIFETFNMVEFSSKAIITDVNQNTLTLFNAPDKSGFIGKHISVFIGEEASVLAWEKLMQGKFYEDVQIVDNGVKKLTVRQKFVPICDKHGTLLRVLLLAFLEDDK